jgi:hypothetical protein
MNTIDGNTMQMAATEVNLLQCSDPGLTIDTVIIELNGAHGGADVTIRGTTPDVRGSGWNDVQYVRAVK